MQQRAEREDRDPARLRVAGGARAADLALAERQGLQAGRDLLVSNAADQAKEGGVVVPPSEPVIPAPAAEAATSA